MNGMRNRLLRAVMILSCWPADVWAATYYVAPRGSDSNSGLSASAPFATLQKAADTATAGDTVLVLNGVYTTPSSGGLINFWRSGTPGAWITFRSLEKWGAKLSGRNQATAYAAYFGSAARYVRLQDFEIFGFSDVGVSVQSASDISVSGNLVHDIGRICTDSGIGRVGMSISDGAANVTVDKNSFYDVGRFSPGENACRPANNYYQNHDHALYVHGSRNVAITNNLFRNITHGWAIHLYPDLVNGLNVVSNTFIGSNPWQRGQIIVGADLNNARFESNVFYYPRSEGIYYYSGSMSNVLVQNNKAFPAPVALPGSWPGGVAFSGNIDRASPGSFVPGAWAP